MASVLTACALLVVMLTVCVVATMAVESWGRTRAARLPDLDHVAPAPDPAPVISEELVVIDGREQADALIGVLFAAYATARRPEANRVSAWVTADRRSSDARSELVPGADLRGRPAAVARLLEHDEDDRSWVTLNSGVDVARGLARRPPRDELLEQLVVVWSATRSAMTLLDAADVDAAASAMAELEPIWRRSPAASELAPLLATFAAASRDGRSVRMHVRLASAGPLDDRVDLDERSPGAAERSMPASLSTPRPSQTV